MLNIKKKQLNLYTINLMRERNDFILQPITFKTLQTQNNYFMKNKKKHYRLKTIKTKKGLKTNIIYINVHRIIKSPIKLRKTKLK